MNMDFIDSKQFGLNSRTILANHNDGIAIVVNRKSRVIMKDGKRIIEQASLIRKKTKKPILLLTSAPVCSKTKLFLAQNNIATESLI